MAQFFKARAYHETISYSFVDPKLQESLYPGQAALSLLNPISSELSQMRQGLWPGLIASMVYNAHRQQAEIKLFEQGVTFIQNKGKLEEHSCLGGLLAGEHGALNWSETQAHFDFYDAKGDLVPAARQPEGRFVRERARHVRARATRDDRLLACQA